MNSRPNIVTLGEW